jgi:hypothetical protein
VLCTFSQQSHYFPQYFFAMGMQRVSANPDGICSGQGDTGSVLQYHTAFVYLRRYITLANEAIFKQILSSSSVPCDEGIDFLYVT